MKERTLIFLLVFVILLILGLIFKNFISASIFDTHAVVQTTSVNITVDGYPPDLIVDSPTSTNYSTKNIDINYSVSDSASEVDTVWYNLDGGQNTTLTGNTTVTVSRGDHNLYIYANDTVGLINDTEFVTFSVNATRTIEINYTRFTGTNLSALNDSDLEDIEDLTLEISSFGKITFGENINISKDTDLDTYMDISDNNIYLNSEVLSNFNKSATLWLYGLTLDDPRILRDGSVCPTSICTKTSYAGGILEFTVTGFTNYSAEETPTGEPGPTGRVTGGGQGGAGGKKVESKVSSFEVDRDLIKVSLKQGETKRELLSIKNTGDTSLDISLDLKNLQEFVIFPGGVSTYDFRLEQGEEQTIQIIFNAANDAEPDVYPGKIIVRADSLQKLITTIVEIESEKPVFDIDVEVLPKDKQVFLGESVSAEIKLFNLLGRRRVDVIVEHGIKDLEGNIILSGSSVVAVETQMSFVRSLIIPFNLGHGTYVFYVKAKYDDTTSTSSDTFQVAKKPGAILAGLSTIHMLVIAIVCLMNLFIILALRDIFIHFKKEREELREEKEIPQEIARPEKEKELKEKKPIKITERLKEKPKKVEVKKESDLKKLIDHVRKKLR